MRLSSILAVILLLFILIPYTMVLAETGVGYIAIRDYLGKIWTMDDVQKILNTTLKGVNGETVNLGEYFYIVIDGEHRYSLRDFEEHNGVAVVAVTVADHVVDIYWFAYHQRVWVPIHKSGEIYYIDLKTAPVLPFSTSGKPSKEYEWSPVANSRGLTIQRRDGKYYIRFNYDSDYVTIAYYSENIGWNMYPIYIDINNVYRYNYFHIIDPGKPEYMQEGNVNIFSGLVKFDIYKLYEKVVFNRTGEILRTTYIVAVAENIELYNAVNDLMCNVYSVLDTNMFSKGFIDPVTYSINKVDSLIDFLNNQYRIYMSIGWASKYQKIVVLVIDVFVTPTQILILGHAYTVVQDGRVVEYKVSSSGAFNYRNTLVFYLPLQGVAFYPIYQYQIAPDQEEYSIASFSGSSGSLRTIYLGGTEKFEHGESYSDGRMKWAGLPGGAHYVADLDDLSKYYYMFMMRFDTRVTGDPYKALLYMRLYYTLWFYDPVKAQIFYNNIRRAGFYAIYLKNSMGATVFVLVFKNVYDLKDVNEVSVIVDPSILENIVKYIPYGSGGKLYISYYVWQSKNLDYRSRFEVEIGENTVDILVSNFIEHIIIMPRMITPQISLLKNGFQVVDNAYAVQVFTNLMEKDEDIYMLGYYLLADPPPPSFVIRDVYYNFTNGVVHYVYMVISADAYGEQVITYDKKYYDTSHVHLFVLRTRNDIRWFKHVYLALFSFSKLRFLNMAPELIYNLVALPPDYVKGYGTPILDWSTVSILTVNMSTGKLYYLENNAWIEVTVNYYETSKRYDIVRRSDNIVVDTLDPGDRSTHYYKYVSERSREGWLFNDNGTLRFITGSIQWSVSEDEMQENNK